MSKKKGGSSRKAETVEAAPQVSRLTRLWMILGIAVVGFFLYRPTLHGPFFLDDARKIISNPDIRVENASQIFSKLVYPYSENRTFDRNDPSRPVTYLSYTLNYLFGKLDPFGYRVVNLLGHIGVGILLFLVSQRLLYRIFGEEQVGLSFFLALLFVVHPVNAIVALYNFNRSDILAALTTLGAVALFLSPAKNNYWKTLGILALFIVGLGSKQSVAVLPMILLVVDFVVVHRGRWNEVRATDHVPFWTVLALYLGWRLAYFGSFGDLEAEVPVERWTYFVSQIQSWTRYLQFFFIPAGLSLDHMPKVYSSLKEPAILFSAGILVALLVAAWAVIRKETAVSRLVLFSVLWFIFQLAPTSSFLPTTTTLAENRLYLSQFGLLLLWGIGVCALVGVDLTKPIKGVSQTIIFGFLGCQLVFFGWLSYQRGVLFSDPVALWEEVLRLYPKQSRALYNLGFIASEKKEYDKALTWYTKAVDANPKYAEALNNIGMIYARRWETEKGIEYFQKSIDALPREISYCNLARGYMNLKKFPEALAALEGAQSLNPSSALAYTLEGRLWYERKDFAKAAELYDKASRFNPEYYELLNNRGLLLLEEKNHEKAIDYFKRSIMANQSFAEAIYNLSVAYAESKQPELSQQYFEQACSLDPQYIFKPLFSGGGQLPSGVMQLPPNIEKYLHPAVPSPQ
jgi:tetratricopeptide (TPR) repeat protein